MDPTASDSPGRPALAAFFVSLGVLTFEISLTRILAFTLIYHFTYVVLGVALLGYGASGAFLAASDRLRAVPPRDLVAWACVAAVASGSVALLAIYAIPFHPLELGSESWQIPIMVVYMLAVTAPFFAGGLAISATLRFWSGRATTIYFADLAGAGLGCALALPAIWWLGAPGGFAAGIALVGVAGVLIAPAQRFSGVSGSVLVAALFCGGLAGSLEMPSRPSSFLTVAAAAGRPPLFTRWSPIFRTDIYESPVGGTRRGVSRHFSGTMPAPLYIAHDGGAEAAMYRFSGDVADLEFFDWHVGAAPYQITRRPEVLVIGVGGGFDILAALRGGARHVTGVDIDPVTIDAVAGPFGEFSGHVFARDDVDVVAAEGRSFLRHGDAKYDVIQLTGVDTFSALSSGAYVMAENYLYTVEAVEEYLAHLTPDGVLSYQVGDFHWRRNHSRFGVRHVQNFIDAARASGIEDPAAHTAVLGKKNGMWALEILFKRSPLTPEDLASLRRFADERDFEFWALPGERVGSTLETLLAGDEATRSAFVASYPLDVRPTRDDRPFFFQLYRWRDVFDPDPMGGGIGHSGAAAQQVLLSMLAFAVVAAFALIGIPLLLSNRRALRTPGTPAYAVFFAALGLGFMLLEISLIQRFVLLLGHPTYAIAVTLAALLASTGIGSYLSGRVGWPPRALLAPTLAVVVAISIGYVLGLPRLFDVLLGAPFAVRAAVSVALLFLLGLPLGVFFPAGLRIVSEREPDLVSWAWGVNGGASVVGSVLAIVLAITLGFPAVTLIAVLLYFGGTAAMIRAPS